jgi:hypothetical protein
MNINLIYGILFFIGGHIIAWFQLNSQFKWDWAKEHEWIMAAIGIPCSFLYIWGTKYTVEGMEGLLWPTRFIGFGIGIIIYGLLVGHFFSEGITTKTFVSLALAIILICINVFWK